jgi:hypothetical protein
MSIGERAFDNCTKLTSVKSYAKTAPELYYRCFPIRKKINTLYYPVGSDYSSWSGYFNEMVEFELEDTAIDEVKGEYGNRKGENVYYDLNGRVVENPTNGVYIINGKKVFIK